MNNTLLTQLKDIHQPAPISWWPPAPGWLILMIIALGVICYAAYYAWYLWQLHRRRRLALQEIQRLRTWFLKHGDKQHVASHLSILMRKILLAKYPRKQVAGLHGDAWLAFLDHALSTNQFTQGDGRLLIDAPYAPQTDESIEQLFILVEHTTKRCL
jgi:hypothetical protein